VESLFVAVAFLVLIGVILHLVYGAIRQGRLSRNRAVGIRTRATMQSHEAWRKGHRAAAPHILSSVLAAYSGAGACLVVGLLTRGQVREALMGVIVAISLGSFLILTLCAARTANKAAGGMDQAWRNECARTTGIPTSATGAPRKGHRKLWSAENSVAHGCAWRRHDARPWRSCAIAGQPTASEPRGGPRRHPPHQPLSGSAR